MYNLIQAYLGDITALVPDQRNKASISVKRVLIYLPVEGLAFNLKKHAIPVKRSKTKYVCSSGSQKYKMRGQRQSVGRALLFLEAQGETLFPPIFQRLEALAHGPQPAIALLQSLPLLLTLLSPSLT